MPENPTPRRATDGRDNNTATGTPLLDVNSVTCGYERAPLVEDVTFRLVRGEAIVLTGPNGAGKSTLLRTLAAQQRALSGELRLSGRPMIENSLFYRQNVSSLFDEDAFLPGLTVRQHLQLVARGHRMPEPDTAVDQALDEFGLIERAAVSPYELSSGQRRRALLATTFLRPFALLILDEPEQRLDGEMRSWLTARLVEHRESGAGILVATHDQGLADAVGTSRVALDAHGGWKLHGSSTNDPHGSA
ncbi:SkfA peptide export ATP-binding protein SkfE [Kocuria varians]|uniref:SkfA peptide export ATP-binding protein SkfE n=1 Tax=Kocuria varians TaxID=1272 RepID=A0A7D7L2L1_KOCVA|nr:SkfA peptide export ATP-binding protein SkfE [Kocuria varians]